MNNKYKLLYKIVLENVKYSVTLVYNTVNKI